MTLSYNVEGVDRGLRLDGGTTADIFLGRIKKWNDPAIARLNDGVDLPDADITVCHRSDESGTTKNFTLFLSDYSEAWRNGPGSDKSVQWPTGTGARGNDGVAGCVKQTQGAIGYVEQAYALQNDFSTAVGPEQGRQLRRAEPRGDLGRRRGRHPAGGSALRDDQRRRRPDATRSRPSRSCSPGRTPAERA